MNDLQTAAIEFHSRGYNVLPIAANKKPALKTWKELQNRPQTRSEVSDLMEYPDLQGVALVCGWNGLTVRDFDRRQSFETWRNENPALANSLPIYETGRGAHVLFKSPGTRTKKLDDGEIRGVGSYAIAPPSRHASGNFYRFINPLTDRLPEVDPGVFIARAQDQSRVAEGEGCYRENREIASVSSVALYLCLSVTDEAEREIGLSLPAVEGQRHRKLFELARRLRALPDFSNVNAKACQNVVRRWHERALPIIGTKAWDETWGEFLIAWPNVKVAFGAGSVSEALKRAESAAFPQELADQYESESARLLLKLCRELDRDTRPKPFYLSCKTAQETLGIDRMTAWRYMRRMVAEGVLEVVEQHTAAKATRYRWIGPDGQ